MKNKNEINTRLERVEDEVNEIRELVNEVEQWSPEVGDWIHKIKGTAHTNLTRQLSEPRGGFDFWFSETKTGFYARELHYFRKATPQEILKAKGIEEGSWIKNLHMNNVFKLSDDRFALLQKHIEYKWELLRPATEQEILTEIAKFEVGEEVWFENHGGFYRVNSRELVENKFVYYNTERVDTSKGYQYAYVYEQNLEKRPQPKWSVGETVWVDSMGVNLPIRSRYWNKVSKEWLYRAEARILGGLYVASDRPCEDFSEARPPQKFKVGQSVKVVGRKGYYEGRPFKIADIIWTESLEKWLYLLEKDQLHSLGWSADYLKLAPKAEVKKRTPKAGEIWRGTLTGRLFLITNNHNTAIETITGVTHEFGLNNAEYYGTFQEVFHTTEEVNDAYEPIAPLGSNLHKGLLKNLKNKNKNK
ncbi:hypothetical protein N9064_00550 [bacterium]|nr:hypothetical protein [bacterium]